MPARWTVVLALSLGLITATPALGAVPAGWTSLGKDFLLPNPAVTNLEFDAEGNGYALAANFAGSATFHEIERPATGGNFTITTPPEDAVAGNHHYLLYDVDDSGRGLVVVNHYGVITERHREGDGAWSPPQELLESGADQAVAAFARDGSGVVAWYRDVLNEANEGTHYVIEARLRNAAGEWGPAETVATSAQDGRWAVAFQAAVAPGGAATIAWNHVDSSGSAGAVHQVTRLPGQAEFAPMEVVHVESTDAFEPVLAMDEQGNATILWAQWTAGACQRIGEATRAPDSATFGEPTWPTLSQNFPDSYRNCTVGQLRVAAAGSGDVAFLMTGSGFGVDTTTMSFAMREPGTRFASIPAFHDVAYQQYGPRLTGGPDGSFLMAFWGGDDANNHSGLEVFLARPGETLSPIGFFLGYTESDLEFDPDGTPFVALNGGPGTTEILAYDDEGPEITGLIAPDGVVGEELTFGFTANDEWSTIDSAGAKWTFSKAGTPTKEATGEAPKLTFTAAEVGTWTVSLEVADGNGNKTTRTGTFKIAAANQAPTAAFTVSPDAPKAQDEVTFNGSASADPDGDPLTFDWDVNGDGTVDKTGGDSIVVAKFPAGSYTAKLTVKDGRGGVANAEKAFTVAAGTVTSTLPTTPPAPGTGDAALEAGYAAKGLDITTPSFVIVSSRREREVPNVVGMPLDEAEEKLSAVHYIDYEIKWTHKLPRSSKAKIGDVLAQEPKPGVVVESGIADRLKVVVTVYAGKKSAKGAACPTGFEKAARGIDWDLGRELIKESCKKKPISDIAYKLGNWDEATITRAKRDKRKLDLTVGLPDDPKDHDLFMIFREADRKQPGVHHTFNSDWQLWTNNNNPNLPSCFQVQVFDRESFFIQNAVVEIDLSKLPDRLTAKNPTFRTNAKGNARICHFFPRSGLVTVVAHATGQNDEDVWGATRVTLKGSTGKSYSSPTGRIFDNTGNWSMPKKKKPRLVARAAFWNELVQAASGLVDSFTGTVAAVTTTAASSLQSLYQSAASLFQSAPTDPAAYAKKNEEIYNQTGVTVANINAAGILNANVSPMGKTVGKVWTIKGGIPPREVAKSVTNGGGGNMSDAEVNKVIASGGGNISEAAVAALRRRPDGSLMEQLEIAQRFARGQMAVIASGGGNVIASGGGNVIASGGGNIASIVAGVIASGGGNVLSGDGMAKVIASGGGNLIGEAGTNLIGEAGSNLAPLDMRDLAAGVIASGGGNVIASGGGNLIGEAGTNLINPGEVVAQVNKVIASGGGNFQLDAGAIGTVIFTADALIGEAGTNLTNGTIAEGAVGADGGKVISVGSGNLIGEAGTNRRLASVANIPRAGDRRWVRRRLQQVGQVWGSIGYATDGEVITLRDYSGIAMSSEGASIFGNGEGITPDRVKDAEKCVVLIVGNNYMLVRVGG